MHDAEVRGLPWCCATGCAASLMWFGTRAIVMVRGQLDEQSAMPVHAYLERVLRSRPKVVVLDLPALHDGDAAGAALLGDYANRAEREGWTLRLRAAPGWLSHTLDKDSVRSHHPLGSLASQS